MESLPEMELGHKQGWLTTLDEAWLNTQLIFLRDFCRETIALARRIGQFLDIVDLIKDKKLDLFSEAMPMAVYLDGRGYLRSAG